MGFCEFRNHDAQETRISQSSMHWYECSSKPRVAFPINVVKTIGEKMKYTFREMKTDPRMTSCDKDILKNPLYLSGSRCPSNHGTPITLRSSVEDYSSRWKLSWGTVRELSPANATFFSHDYPPARDCLRTVSAIDELSIWSAPDRWQVGEDTRSRFNVEERAKRDDDAWSPRHYAKRERKANWTERRSLALAAACSL